LQSNHSPGTAVCPYKILQTVFFMGIIKMNFIISYEDWQKTPVFRRRVQFDFLHKVSGGEGRAEADLFHLNRNSERISRRLSR